MKLVTLLLTLFVAYVVAKAINYTSYDHNWYVAHPTYQLWLGPLRSVWLVFYALALEPLYLPVGLCLIFPLMDYFFNFCASLLSEATNVLIQYSD